MGEKDKTRKYMLQDIIKHNLKFIWIILICMILVSAILGIKKNREFEQRFYNMKQTGTTYSVSCMFYTGNINSDSVYTRVNNVKLLFESNKAYQQYVMYTHNNIEYDKYAELFQANTDYDNDYLSVVFKYPVGIEDRGILEEKDALDELEKYAHVMSSLCDEVIGQDKAIYLGTNQMVSQSNEPTDENYKIARQEVTKQVVVGMILGAILSISVITLLYLMDTRVKSSQLIASCMNIPLIGYFGKNDFDKEFEKVRLLTYDWDSARNVINIMNLRDTRFDATTELASSFFNAGKKTIIIDFEKHEEKLGLEDYILGKCDLEDIICHKDNGCDTIVRNASRLNPSIVENPKYSELIETLRSHYECILINTADSVDNTYSVFVAQRCDRTYFVAENRKHKEKNIYNFIDELKLFEIDYRGVMVYEPQK